MLSSDWWLKKALKFALKRYLGKIIQTEIDADQLEVQLGQGLLELRGVLLKCDHLNEQLGESVWEIKAGYVGKLRLVIPMSKLSTDSCTLEMDEILLTVGLRASKSSQSQTVSGGIDQENKVDESANSPISGFFDFDEGPIKPSAITTGIAKIAGGMENILQKLKLQANGLAIRFELPGNSTGHLTPLVVFKLQTFLYEGEMEAKPDKNKQAGDVPHMQLHKALSFTGLTIELFEDELDEEVVNQNPPQPEIQATASHTNLPARVTWADEISPQDPGMNTQYGSSGEIQEDEISNISGDGWHDFSSKDLGIPGSPAILIDHNLLEQGSNGDDLFEDSRHIVICDHEGIGCTGSLQLELVWQTSSQNRPTITADLILKPFQVQLHPHHLPLISSLVSIAGTNTPSPNNGAQEELLQDSHSRSILADILMPDTTTLAQDLVYESWYHDKASANSGSEYFDAESLLGSLRSGLSSFASASASGLAQGANYFSSSITGFEMGNSATPLPVPDTGKLHLTFSTQDLSLVLWYPQTSKQMLNEVTNFPNLIRARDWSATDDYRPRLSLEAGDILLTHESLGQESSTTIQVFRIEAVDHIPVLSSESNLSPSSLNDMVKLPEALPPISSGVRQVPSFSGVCISPMRKSMYASMLSHVSSLSASMGLNSTSGPQVQISPVLCIAGSVKAARGSPSLTISLITRKDSERKSVLKEEISTVLDFKLRATSAWVNIPLLTRLFGFLEPLIIHLGAPTSSQGFSSNNIQSETRNSRTIQQRTEMKTSGPKHIARTNLEVKGSLSNVSIFLISDG